MGLSHEEAAPSRSQQDVAFVALGADEREPYGLPVQGRDQPKAQHESSQGRSP
jgi:hypothetical protein